MLPARLLPALTGARAMDGVLDPEEFGRLFARHARLAWVVAAAHVPRALAEDVVQEAAATALARLDRFASGTDFRAWFVQIVRFTAAAAARRRRRDPLSVHDVEEPSDRPANGTSSSAAVDGNGRLRDVQRDFDDRVVAALRDLPDDARAALLMRVVLDMDYGEIAATLDVPPGTVASHLHRARAVLRERLAPDAARAAERTPR